MNDRRSSKEIPNTESIKVSEIKGIKVRNLSLGFILLEALFVVVSIICSVITSEKYNTVDRLNQDYMQMQSDIYNIKEASDYLTDRCRQYVMTGDVNYANEYLDEINVTMRRENAIDNVHEAMQTFGLPFSPYLDEALTESNALSEIEMHAMALVGSTRAGVSDLPQALSEYTLSGTERSMSVSDRQKLASELVFGRGYSDEKSVIMNFIDDASENLLSQVRKYLDRCTRAYHKAAIVLKLLLVICGINLCCLGYIIYKFVLLPITKCVTAIENDQKIEYGRGYEFNYLAYAFNHLQEKNIQVRIKLKDSAERDALTGFLNRNGYEEIKQYYENNADPIALIIVDIDNFKSINDTFGHEVGDEALKKAAAILGSSFRDTDYLVRFGGDEFLVIMTGVGSQSRSIIEKKLKRINAVLHKESEEVRPAITVSIGVAMSDQGYTEDLFKKADDALYKTKEQGKNGYNFA